METREVLAGLRKNKGLTQDEMAAKLYVTRQAVSRWENGETTPNTETLKLISREFDVSINTLLGQPQEESSGQSQGQSQGPICQSCAMPLREFDDLGTEADEGVSTEYCVHCYQKGSYTHNRTIEEMIESNLRFLNEFNEQNGLHFSEDEARLTLKAHLATLKRWREN